MNLPEDVRARFRRYGQSGGRERAARMTPASRAAIARRASMARWIRHRFGAPGFEALGLPGGDLVDAGLADLARGEATAASLLVSLAVPRLKREGVPVGAPLPDPEERLYRLFEREHGDLAHHRYNAHLRRIVSFADACGSSRIDRGRRAR